MSLYKQILNFNFLKKNQMLFNFRKANEMRLFQYLKSQGFEFESTRFLNEKIDGSVFIVLMTEKGGLDLLEKEFQFSPAQSSNLKQFYECIYRFRQMFCNNFQEDEIPFYI
eukprot:TRINITY_DN2983_c0_g1_i1.p1 TRINITY_DN2983_c0_g1~~TRINITY_DN2983_c0_g1_i1.p1  ORF type:complete len:111 (-),score=11.41 TRINITY_DN2983_c0_g1_i1:60-392(-)